MSGNATSKNLSLWGARSVSPPPPHSSSPLIIRYMHEPIVKRQKTTHSPTHTRAQHSILSSPRLLLALTTYWKLILHTCGLIVLLLAIYFVISTSRIELNGRVAQMQRELEEEKIQCAQKFRDNQCDLYAHKHFFGSFCNQWEQCMKRDLREVGRAKITMAVYGEMVNALVEPLTIKAMLVICLLIFGIFVSSCLLF